MKKERERETFCKRKRKKTERDDSRRKKRGREW